MIPMDYLPKITSQIKELIVINLPDWEDVVVRNQMKSFFTTLAIFSGWLADTSNSDDFLFFCFNEARERYKELPLPLYDEFENEMYEFLV